MVHFAGVGQIVGVGDTGVDLNSCYYSDSALLSMSSVFKFPNLNICILDATFVLHKYS